MLKRGPKTLAVVISVLLFMTVLMVIESRPATASEPAKILIGTTVSESGYMAEDSGPSFKGRKLAIDLINQKGGLLLSKYNKRVPVELIYYDDKSEPSTTVKSFQRLATRDRGTSSLRPMVPSCLLQWPRLLRPPRYR